MISDDVSRRRDEQEHLVQFTDTAAQIKIRPIAELRCPPQQRTNTKIPFVDERPGIYNIKWHQVKTEAENQKVHVANNYENCTCNC